MPLGVWDVQKKRSVQWISGFGHHSLWIVFWFDEGSLGSKDQSVLRWFLYAQRSSWIKNKIVSVESHSKVEQWLKIFEGIVYESLHIEKNMFAIRVSSPLCCKYKGEDLCAAFVYDLWKNHKLEGVDYTHNKAISQMKEKEIQSIRRFLIVWWLDSDSQWVEWVESKNWSLQTIEVLYRNKLQKSTRGEWSSECFPRDVPLVVLGVQLSFRCSQIWFVISECNGSLYQ